MRILDIESTYIDKVRFWTTRYKLNPYMVRAMILVESGGLVGPTRYESHYKWLTSVHYWANRLGITVDTEKVNQMTSHGLMQVMGANYRSYGYAGYWPQASDVDNSIRYGCKHLYYLDQKYSRMEDVISAYNQGSPRKVDGDKYLYINQGYVDRVLEKMDKLKDLEGG